MFWGEKGLAQGQSMTFSEYGSQRVWRDLVGGPQPSSSFSPPPRILSLYSHPENARREFESRTPDSNGSFCKRVLLLPLSLGMLKDFSREKADSRPRVSRGSLWGQTGMGSLEGRMWCLMVMKEEWAVHPQSRSQLPQGLTPTAGATEARSNGLKCLSQVSTL